MIHVSSNARPLEAPVYPQKSWCLVGVWGATNYWNNQGATKNLMWTSCCQCFLGDVSGDCSFISGTSRRGYALFVFNMQFQRGANAKVAVWMSPKLLEVHFCSVVTECLQPSSDNAFQEDAGAPMQSCFGICHAKTQAIFQRTSVLLSGFMLPLKESSGGLWWILWLMDGSLYG